MWLNNEIIELEVIFFLKNTVSKKKLCFNLNKNNFNTFEFYPNTF